MALFFRKKKNDDAIETEEARDEVPVVPEHGPWDASQVDDEVDRLDCGALKVPKTPGARIQFSLNRKSRQAIGLVVQLGASQLDVAVFAAPKSRDIWPDKRQELLDKAQEAGGSGRFREGPFGPEVEALVPRKDVNETRHLRYVGVDGYRWMLRAIISGLAATDEDEREALYKILKDIVVDRGSAPHPVGSVLPLTMSDEMKKKVEEKLGPPKIPSRGPSITEIR